ncbi:putative inner membrane protein [Salmonella bongori]|nr:putative inner membrane protein [Salmonella bongori]
MWADVLEELTTTWYFGTALIVLWLLSRVLQNNILLALAGAGYPGRARRGVITGER